MRVTDAKGKVTVFKTKNFTNDISKMDIRKMDCMDCHNRPSHRYLSPENAVNQAMALKKIDPGLPWIKTNAMYVLTRNYANEAEARNSIASLTSHAYPNDARVKVRHRRCATDLFGQFFPGDESELELISGRCRPHDLARLFPLPRRPAQDRDKKLDHQGQRLQFLPYDSRAR